MTVYTRTDNGIPAPTAPLSPEAAPATADLVAKLDSLRFAAGEADVLAAVTVEWFDGRDWGNADPLEVERLAYLLGLIAKASTAVVTAVARFHGALADVQPAASAAEWYGESVRT